MARLILTALAATAAATPLGAQTPPAPPPPPQLIVAAPDAPPPPPGVTWRQRSPVVRQRIVVRPGPVTEVAPGVQTRTWIAPAAPPPPPPAAMAGGMHHPDGAPPRAPWMHGRDGHDGPPHGPWMHGRDGREIRRHVEVFRMGPGYDGPMGPDFVEGAPPPPPPPCTGPCGPMPMPYGPVGGYGYGYAYGGGGVVVTETTVTEAPVVERRVWYTSVREKVRVAPRHAVRRCRCKLVKARPSPGERG